MALFGRRKLQQLIDANRARVSEEKLKDWVRRLNSTADDYLATEWEITLLDVFATLGTVLHEQGSGARKIDLEFSNSDGTLSFGADIVTISDQQLNRENPVDSVDAELRRLVRKARIRSGGFHTQVGEASQPTYPGSGNQRSLLLPEVKDFDKYIFNDGFRSFLRAIKLSPRVMHVYRAKDAEAGVDVSITYQPGARGWGLGYGSYTCANVIDDNPLYNALKTKHRQLKQSGYRGRKGIIVCDGGCRFLTLFGKDWSSFSVEQVIQEFFRQHSSIDFVVVLTVTSPAGYWPTHKQRHPVQARLFLRKSLGLEDNRMHELVGQVIGGLPEIQQSPQNAVGQVKAFGQKGRHRAYMGGSEMSGKKVRISARELLELMAGSLDPQRFAENHDTGGGNYFAHRLQGGELIVAATLKRRPDEDDDWITFEFGPADPAVAPFCLPAKRGS